MTGSISNERFRAATGRAPSVTETLRLRCPRPGSPGHEACGWDYVKELPMWETAHHNTVPDNQVVDRLNAISNSAVTSASMEDLHHSPALDRLLDGPGLLSPPLRQDMMESKGLSYGDDILSDPDTLKALRQAHNAAMLSGIGFIQINYLDGKLSIAHLKGPMVYIGEPLAAPQQSNSQPQQDIAPQ